MWSERGGVEDASKIFGGIEFPSNAMGMFVGGAGLGGWGQFFEVVNFKMVLGIQVGLQSRQLEYSRKQSQLEKYI